MAKITAFSRIQHHGVTDPLSGATIPTSNDHTDGTWAITDIYDRELMINTGSATLQFRAGNDIGNVVSSTFFNIKVYAFQIGGWDMSTAGATDAITIGIGANFANKLIVGMDAMIYPDPTSVIGTNGLLFKYNHLDGTSASDTPLRLGFSDITNADVVIEIDTGGGQNYFRFLSDGIDATFTDTSVNRGYIIITYID